MSTSARRPSTPPPRTHTTPPGKSGAPDIHHLSRDPARAYPAYPSITTTSATEYLSRIFAAAWYSGLS